VKIKMETWATWLSFKSVVGWINWDGFRLPIDVVEACISTCFYAGHVCFLLLCCVAFQAPKYSWCKRINNIGHTLFCLLLWDDGCVIKSNRLSKVYVVAYVPIFQLWSEYLFKLCASFIIYFSIDSIFHSSYQQLMAFPAVLGA